MFRSISETRGTDISTKTSGKYVLKQTELRVGRIGDSKGYYIVLYSMFNLHTH